MRVDPRIVPKKVRWKKHRSPLSLVKTFFGAEDVPTGELGGFEGLDEKGNAIDFTLADFVRTVRDNGFWAFCATQSTPPVVHYWHKPGTPLITLAFLLGHELGHASGKPSRNEWKEEDRADEYGAVVLAVMKRLGVGR